MKAFLPLVLILSLASFCSAISVDQVVNLTKQKTSDELLIQLIQKEGLDRPITSKDVLYLKENGVSEPVIQYLVKLSNPEKQNMLPQEGKSDWISDNMRAYYTTTKDGKKIRVVTNLDEHGKRIGGELPPQPEPAREQRPEYAYEPPREIRVVLEQPQERVEPEQPMYPPEQYFDTGIPLYGGGYGSYYSPFLPYSNYYPYQDNFHRPFHHQNFPDTIAFHRPLRNHRAPAYVPKNIPGASAGMHRRIR